MYWDVMEVEALDGYRFHVRFADGLEGEVDMSEFVRAPDAGVFAVLADPHIFAQAYVEFGAVTWLGELDLVPDAMHDEIKKNGVWKLNENLECRRDQRGVSSRNKEAERRLTDLMTQSRQQSERGKTQHTHNL